MEKQEPRPGPEPGHSRMKHPLGTLRPGRTLGPILREPRAIIGGVPSESVLNILLRWDHGQLGWHDPETGQHIIRYENLEARADAAETRVRELERERSSADRAEYSRPEPSPRSGGTATTPGHPEPRAR